MDSSWRIYTEDVAATPQIIQEEGVVKSSIVNQGCVINGHVENSVLFTNVVVKKGAVIKDSVIMPNSVINEGAQLKKVLVGPDVKISANKVLKTKRGQEVMLIHKNV